MRLMPRETDERRLRVLLEAFSEQASNVPYFTRTAVTGGVREDEGIENLIGGDYRLPQKKRMLKQAIAEWLQEGGEPTVETSAGDTQMGLDAARYYHFRIQVEGARLFVKVALEAEMSGEPEVTVISVKRDDRAWA
jgi:hypothetical protein